MKGLDWGKFMLRFFFLVTCNYLPAVLPAILARIYKNLVYIFI